MGVETFKYLRNLLPFAYFLCLMSTDLLLLLSALPFLNTRTRVPVLFLTMSTGFASNNRYIQMGVNHGNIYTCTEPRPVSHPQDTLVSDSEDRINAATPTAIDYALIKAQRCLGRFQDTASASQNSQVVGVAERLDSLLLDIKDLNPNQPESLENGVIATVFSLLYCCVMEDYELKPTTLAISSLCDQLDA